MVTDQAERLREMAAAYRRDLVDGPPGCRVVAITSGKGGAGKTFLGPVL